MTDDLDFGTKEKVLTQGIYVKYESSITYHSKAMANVKVVADKQTDNLTDGQTDKTKTISPQSIDAGHKKVRTRTYKHTVKPVLETTCIKQPPDLRDHCFDTIPLLKSTK